MLRFAHLHFCGLLFWHVIFLRFQCTHLLVEHIKPVMGTRLKTLERDYFRKVFSYNWRDTSQKMSRFSLTKKENWISFLCFVCTPIFGLLECWNYYRIEEQKVQNCFFETGIFFQNCFIFWKAVKVSFQRSRFKFLGTVT